MLEEEPMHDWQNLSHVRWECKYHVIVVPKYRKRVIYGKIRRRVGEILKDLCRQRGIEMIEGHLMPDHIHMCLSVPPKFSIAFAIGFLKGKSAVRIHRQILRNKRVTGLHFWSRGYCVSTVGLDETTIRKYIRDQDKLEKQQMEIDFT
jgi:putative transposase